MNPNILFLDFDGVLHPVGGASSAGLFCRLPLLESLLREPELLQVSIVITSTWRQVYPLDRLLALFSLDIRPRVIDTTPVHKDEDSNFVRYREICAWLEIHPEVKRWVIVDDAESQFPSDKRANLVCTDPWIGLEIESLHALRQRLGDNPDKSAAAQIPLPL